MTNSPFLTRVVLKNYKSIEACDVDLHSLTFLVGEWRSTSQASMLL